MPYLEEFLVATKTAVTSPNSLEQTTGLLKHPLFKKSHPTPETLLTSHHIRRRGWGERQIGGSAHDEGQRRLGDLEVVECCRSVVSKVVSCILPYL